MTFLLLLANLLFGVRTPALPERPRRDAATTAACAAQPVFTADAPGGSEATSDALQQRRSQFIELVKTGVFERFDDSRQLVLFKRNDPSRAAHEPGPLEDEAIASAARDSLAPVYAKLKLRLRVSCKSGKLSIGSLPDDPAAAASVMDMILVLDGVQTVAAALPVSLRLP